MKQFQEYINFPQSPVSHEASIVHYKNVRLTILTSRLIRIEYSQIEKYRDVATQMVINRQLPTPDFDVVKDENFLEVTTDHLVFRYDKHPRGFTRDSLSILVKETGKKWVYGTSSSNLKGTCRTLDGVDGRCGLEDGLISRDGYAVVDDTQSFTFDNEGWFKETYYPAGEYEDLYFFGHGLDYKGALKDFMAIAGKVPMLPRWTLGNWWSRYWEYDEKELLDLMKQFKEEAIPLSVCIIDMDWHVTDVKGRGSSGWSAGWTGYTWNKELFPDPQAFLDELHGMGIRTSLNLHPADGLLPHEDMYDDMANFMGMDPALKEQIPFDIVDKKFMEGYFNIMHRPHEEAGIDFWWMDWQQGSKLKNSYLDPLFLLNHLHYLDAGRDETKRPFVFSRWGGLGNHRYPIGFSGDTHSTWASLKFQAYVTSTAANVGYGWWSHDIGGHGYAPREGELYARWVQLGVFSPIMRLHSTKRAHDHRHPWGYDRDILDVTREVMQLRHQLIPYIYTMSWMNYQEDVPFILPLYYEHPEVDEAYLQEETYYFGKQLIVSPYLSKMDEELGLSHHNVWLPEGDWYNFFNGDYYVGDRKYPLYGELKDVPVFAKAGSIVPLGERVNWDGVDAPTNMELHIFPGADGEFTLFEDDGESQGYLKGEHAMTTFTQHYNEGESIITLQPIEGNQKHIPSDRTYTLKLKGYRKPEKIILETGGDQILLDFDYDEPTQTVSVAKVQSPIDQEIKIIIQGQGPLARQERDSRKVLRLLTEACRVTTDIKDVMYYNIEELMEDPTLLLKHPRSRNEVSQTMMQAVMEIVYDKPYFMMK